MHPFGLSDAEGRELDELLSAIGDIDVEPGWWSDPELCAELLRILARINALIPPGTTL